MISLFSDNSVIQQYNNTTIQQYNFIRLNIKCTIINKLQYDSIEYLVTLRHNWITNLPVHLFMAPMVLNVKLYHAYYIVAIDMKK